MRPGIGELRLVDVEVAIPRWCVDGGKLRCCNVEHIVGEHLIERDVWIRAQPCGVGLTELGPPQSTARGGSGPSISSDGMLAFASLSWMQELPGP